MTAKTSHLFSRRSSPSKTTGTNKVKNEGLTFQSWANEMRKDDGDLPTPTADWKSWAATVNQLNTYNYVSTIGYNDWDDWSDAFLMANQGS